MIRLASENDAEEIADLLLEAFREYEPLYTPAGFSATTPNADTVRQRLREGPMWVVQADQKCVGTVAALPQGECLYMRSMAVLPDARGQRIGETLLRQVEDWAVRNGYKTLTLSTTPFLARAIRLYEQFGFQYTGERDLFGTPLLTMEKKLSGEKAMLES